MNLAVEGFLKGPDRLIVTVSETVASAQSIEQLTRPLLELLQHVTGLESTYLTQVDLPTRTQRVLFSRNTRSMEIPEGISVPWGNALCKRAMDEECILVADAGERWRDSEYVQSLGLETYASTPILLGDGSLFGTLCAASSEKREFTDDTVAVLSLFSTLISQHIQRERLLERLQKANAALEAYSFYDALTGLPNRRFVINEMRRLSALAVHTGKKLLVAFIDLDDFKSINDRYGHQAGDALLTEIGQRLSDAPGTPDLVGRLGGDEFVVVVLADADAEDGGSKTDEVYDQLASLLCGHYDVPDGASEFCGASVGVFEAEPGSMSPESMLRRADELMYADKKSRRSKRSEAERADHSAS
ncbi:sensor domain-containing diguanylate cyclase [Acuticoccus sp. MNP-M23]|uniref:GGDEF domain-containing protein n=1 Tax=Acuticoccus sp. MNP-M23 TaxID=3072793 RepID=UPI00281610A7|nr:sensor domain-containing diguanylate cyclase [Acuticoccus sp. MNP-M23]WMS43949.1 sensor domain-containing diguanylate cyclase [Acuticoccus sp. MNP-M23]